MRNLLLPLAVFCAVTPAVAAAQPAATHTPASRLRAAGRPAITGIAFVRFSTSDPAAEEKFFADELGYKGYVSDPDAGSNAHRIDISPRQSIETVPGPPVQTAAGPNRLLAVGLETSSVPAMRAWLAAHGVTAEGPVEDHRLTVHDPEGNTIVFTDRVRPTPAAPPSETKSGTAISHRIIHAGFVVESAAKEDAFYRDILGFHPYWHGGMKEGMTDWSSVQVPDGTDWIEYMLNNKPDTSATQRGVSNHVSLGVVKMDAVVAQLKANGCDTKECTSSQMGRDGKVQLNLYDPDHTRVEVMEFQPTGTVCCSPYTGAMPGPVEPAPKR